MQSEFQEKEQITAQGACREKTITEKLRETDVETHAGVNQAIEAMSKCCEVLSGQLNHRHGHIEASINELQEFKINFKDLAEKFNRLARQVETAEVGFAEQLSRPTEVVPRKPPF